MIFRPLLPTETELLKDFLYEAIFIPEGVEAPAREIIELPELRIYYEDFGSGKADYCIVADDDGKVVGAVWTRIMNDYGHVDDETPSFAISLYKEYRGRGIGTRLMREMLALLKIKGYKRASLAVQKANYAVRLYKKVGFKITDENAEEYIMVRELENLQEEHDEPANAHGLTVLKGSRNMIDEIREKLFEMQDLKYREFSSKLISTASIDTFIGVRTPELRSYAKELVKREKIGEFLTDLPHNYFDENQLHAFIISAMKDYDKCMAEVERFLPYVDNWATCDQMSPKVFKKHKPELLEHVTDWVKSGKTYTIRFGVGMLMEHFLDDDFDPAYPETVAGIRSEEYYVNMMIAWYFATALAKQYDSILPYIENRRLDTWTHNKAIQKSVESYRITPEQKEYLKGLKIKAKG